MGHGGKGAGCCCCQCTLTPLVSIRAALICVQKMAGVTSTTRSTTIHPGHTPLTKNMDVNRARRIVKETLSTFFVMKMVAAYVVPSIEQRKSMGPGLGLLNGLVEGYQMHTLHMDTRLRCEEAASALILRMANVKGTCPRGKGRRGWTVMHRATGIASSQAKEHWIFLVFVAQ